MIRRSARLPALFAVVAVMVAGAAEGCGGGDVASSGGAPGDDASSPEKTPGEDGSPSPSPSPTSDGGPGDAATDGNAPDANDGAVEIDAGVDAEPAGPLSPSYVDYDINHVLVTGQSNSTANSGTPVVSTMQPYTNIMFTGGVMTGANPGPFIPLVEGDNGVETIGSGMANRITQFALETFEFGVRAGYPLTHDVLISNHGRSGRTYWCLRKGGCSYIGGLKAFDEAIIQVTKGKELADAAGKSYAVRAVATIHGESDHTSYCGCAGQNPEFPLDGTDGSFRTIKDYSDGLLEWQRDYEAMVKGITGQAQPVPLFVSQISGWNNSKYSKIASFQVDAHKRAPGKVVLVGASYPFDFREDCLHYRGPSQNRLGEYFAKVYAKVVFKGEAWEPVRPKTITRVNNVLTVKYHVPVPPLVLDTVKVTNPGSYGFEFVDDNGPIDVSSVVVSGPDTLTITLASTPTGANKRLLYAQNQIPQTCVGPGTGAFAGGARGNVRDSDATTSRNGYALENWGVIFDEAVP